MLSELNSDLEKAQSLQNVMIASVTGQVTDESSYRELRAFFMDHPVYRDLLPSFVRENRVLGQFWPFMSGKFGKYAERRAYIWSEFTPLTEYLEGRNRMPLDASTSDALKSFDEENVHSAWQRALDRRKSDPQGAITASRTLLETVCKHILDARGVEYDADRIELPDLYRMTSHELNLAPSQHTEEVFRQILGSCTAVVSGLGTLRNRLGDAHGKGANAVKPASRHAELAVNLAGSVALFLVSTWRSRTGD